MTHKQKAIIQFIALRGGEAKKSEIVEAYKHWYYHNSAKYIGEILSRLVKSKKIRRLRKGVYAFSPPVESLSSAANLFNSPKGSANR